MCWAYVNICQWHYFVTSEGSLTNELTSQHQRYLRQCFSLLGKYQSCLHEARGQTRGGKGYLAVLRGMVAGLLSPTAQLQPVPGCCSHLLSFVGECFGGVPFYEWFSALGITQAHLCMKHKYCAYHKKYSFYYHIHGIFIYPVHFPHWQTDLFVILSH